MVSLKIETIHFSNHRFRKKKAMDQTQTILNYYFPTDISNMILRMVYQAEHEEHFAPVLHGIQMEKIQQVYETLNEHMSKYSVIREYCVNGTSIIQRQPNINLNELVLKLLSEHSPIEHILQLVNNCSCCVRHSHNKPCDIHIPYKMSFDPYSPIKYQNKYKQKNQNGNGYCHCKCRKIARMILIAYHDLFHMDSLYYRTILLHNYCQSVKNLEFHKREIERVYNNPQSRKRRRKSYHVLKEHKSEVEKTQRDLKYEIAYLQYHLTMFPNIKKEDQYLHLYEKIPIENVDIQTH